MNQLNSDGTDSEMSIVFVNSAYEWFKDMVYVGIQLCGALILGAVGVSGLAFGLRAAGLF